MIWKKEKKQENVVVEEPKMVVKEKTTKELIEEIHETFYTEVDRLLAEAKIMKSTETQKQDLIDKTSKLKELGFSNTKECKEADEEIARLRLLESENNSKEELKEAINYFSVKYPLYKFITESSVKKICKKYGLIYGKVSKYEGTVPDDNIKHMQEFKIDKEDECYIYNREYMSMHMTILGMGSRRRYSYISYEQSQKHLDVTKDRKIDYNYLEINEKCPLDIAAPISDFNTDNMEVEDFQVKEKVQIPDPVVLQPIFYKGSKHYLIVTAWGDEASDPLVVNEKNN